jgi:hypothetical protein
VIILGSAVSTLATTYVVLLCTAIQARQHLYLGHGASVGNNQLPQPVKSASFVALR